MHLQHVRQVTYILCTSLTTKDAPTRGYQARVRPEPAAQAAQDGNQAQNGKLTAYDSWEDRKLTAQDRKLTAQDRKLTAQDRTA